MVLVVGLGVRVSVCAYVLRTHHHDEGVVPRPADELGDGAPLEGVERDSEDNAGERGDGHELCLVSVLVVVVVGFGRKGGLGD